MKKEEILFLFVFVLHINFVAHSFYNWRRNFIFNEIIKIKYILIKLNFGMFNSINSYQTNFSFSFFSKLTIAKCWCYLDIRPFSNSFVQLSFFLIEKPLWFVRAIGGHFVGAVKYSSSCYKMLWMEKTSIYV